MLPELSLSPSASSVLGMPPEHSVPEVLAGSSSTGGSKAIKGFVFLVEFFSVYPALVPPFLHRTLQVVAMGTVGGATGFRNHSDNPVEVSR